MTVLEEHDGKTFRALEIDAPDEFVSPFQDVLFPCMIWDHRGHFSKKQRKEVASRLLEAGCRYVVCGGYNCEAWHDAVDQEFVCRHVDDSEETRDGVHVMTTGHEEETADDVATFFVLNTNFGAHEFRHYLILHVGSGEAKPDVDAAVRRYAVQP